MHILKHTPSDLEWAKMKNKAKDDQEQSDADLIQLLTGTEQPVYVNIWAGMMINYTCISLNTHTHY